MKQIMLNEEMKKDLMKKFEDYLNTAKVTDNRIFFNPNIALPQVTNKRTTVYISPTAYLKMMLYVRDTSTEIAWHGTVERNTEKNYYFIKDVFLYPQKLSAATVQTDQEKYQDWLDGLDDDTFNTLRFQGHSHVNFGVTPSGTDMTYYEDILNVLPRNDYYIFMILNKMGDMTLLIYDLAANVIYERTDIDIKIISKETQDLIKDIADDKNKFCETPPTYNYAGTGYTYKDFMGYTGYNQITEPKTKTDLLFDELDKKYNKFKNSQIKIKKGGKK